MNNTLHQVPASYEIVKSHTGEMYKVSIIGTERIEATLQFRYEEGIATELTFWRSPLCDIELTYDLLLDNLVTIVSTWLSPEVDISSQDFDLWHYHVFAQAARSSLSPFVLIRDQAYDISDQRAFEEWHADRHAHWMKYVPDETRVRLRFGVTREASALTLNTSHLQPILRESAVNPSIDFITDKDRERGWLSGIIRTRMGQAIFDLIKNWVLPPKGRKHVPTSHRFYTGPNIARPFKFVVRDMPISVWDVLIVRHGFHTDLERI